MKKLFALALVLALALCLFTACGGGNTSAPPASSGASDDNAKSKEKGALPPDTVRRVIGETKEAEGVVVTLDEVWVSTYSDPNFSPPPEGHVYFYPHLTITNKAYDGKIKDALQFAGMGNYVWIGDEKYGYSMNSLLAYVGDATQMDSTPVLNLGDTVTGMTGFTIPENWDKIRLVISHMLPAIAAPGLDITFELTNPDYDPVLGEREKAAKEEELANKSGIDPTLALISLSKETQVYEDEFTKWEFKGFRINDIDALRTEERLKSLDISESYHIEIAYSITNKTGKKVKLMMISRSINESIFHEYKYDPKDLDKVINYSYGIKFKKDENIELDPTDIKTIRFHYIIFDESKTKDNYAQNPIFEGYIVLNIPQ